MQLAKIPLLPVSTMNESPVEEVGTMRRAGHIRPQELMNPDWLSETVLVGSVLLVVGFLLFVLMQAQVR
jgi:hypothetical protein